MHSLLYSIHTILQHKEKTGRIFTCKFWENGKTEFLDLAHIAL